MTSEDHSSPRPATPRCNERVSSAADAINNRNHFDTLRRLQEISSEAEAAGDEEIASAARVEYNVLLTFEDENSLSRFGSDLRSHLLASDVDYLRERARDTANYRVRAQHLYAVASLTNRHDDANAGVDAMLDALRHARSVRGEREELAEAFDWLRDLYPLAFRLARRARALRSVIDEAIEFIASDGDGFVHVKARVFCTIVTNYRLEAADVQRLRDPSLALIFAARAGYHGDIEAVAGAGRRLADRLVEAHTPWLEAEAHALEAKRQSNSQPMLVQMIGVRLLRIYQILGDEGRVSATIERNRAAAAAVEYETFTFELEDGAASEQRYRAYARSMYARFGVAGALAAIAGSPVFPKVIEIRANVERMEAEGIGTFRQLAQTIVSADERIIAENPPDRPFYEQYDIAWTLVSRGHGIMLEEYLAAGLTLDAIESSCALRG